MGTSNRVPGVLLDVRLCHRSTNGALVVECRTVLPSDSGRNRLKPLVAGPVKVRNRYAGCFGSSDLLERIRIAAIKAGKGISKRGREFARRPFNNAADVFIDERKGQVSEWTTRSNGSG